MEQAFKKDSIQAKAPKPERLLNLMESFANIVFHKTSNYIQNVQKTLEQSS